MKYQVRQSDLTLFIDSPISILDLFQKFHLSKKTIHLMKQNKSYLVNNRYVSPSTILVKGDQITFKAFQKDDGMYLPVYEDLDIIYEDDLNEDESEDKSKKDNKQKRAKKKKVTKTKRKNKTKVKTKVKKEKRGRSVFSTLIIFLLILIVIAGICVGGYFAYEYYQDQQAQINDLQERLDESNKNEDNDKESQKPSETDDKNKATDKKTDESDRTNESNDKPIEDNGTEDSNDIPLDEGDVNTGNESNQ